MAALASVETQVAKGNVLVAEAEKTLKKSGLSTFFAPKGQKFEDAAELFHKAANSYKLGKEYQLAGEAYSRSGECHKQAEAVSFECGNMFKEAGECFKEVNPQEAVNAWRQAIEIFSENGRWNMCGQMMKGIAEIYEQGEMSTDGGSSEDAIQCYEQAEMFFKNDNRTQNANQCTEKIAMISASNENFTAAAGKFEELARGCMEKKLTSFNAKNYFIKCLVCHLAAEDTVAACSKLDEFIGLDYTFDGTREHRFVQAVIEAVQNNDAGAFAAAAKEFQSVKKMDPWMISILLKSKRGIDKATADGAEEGHEQDPNYEGGMSGVDAGEEEDLT